MCFYSLKVFVNYKDSFVDKANLGGSILKRNYNMLFYSFKAW